MLIRLIFAGIGAILLLHMSPVSAQAINVSLDATADDDIGRQLAFKIRQKIASSPLMAYVSDDKVGSLKMRLITLNPDDDNKTQSYTVYSFTLVFHPKGDGLENYLTSTVGTCGRSKVDPCANSLIAKIDEWAEMFRKPSSK